MNNFFHGLLSLLLAAALLFSVYIMISGFGAFIEGDRILAKAKLIIGLVAATYTVVNAFIHMQSDVPAVKAILFPITYVLLCLWLNDEQGLPFTDWPTLQQLLS